MPSFRQAAVLMSAVLLMPAAVAAHQLWTHAPVPRSAEVLGFVGNIGEWEMTATLAQQGDTRELAGTMKMAHVGWCSKDGPQEKTGELRIKLARLSAAIEATVWVDGVPCAFAGRLSDAYTGTMACPDRKPVQMLLWMR